MVLNSCCSGFIEWGFAIMEEAFAKAYSAELEGDGLVDLVIFKINEFKAATAEIHLQEVL